MRRPAFDPVSRFLAVLLIMGISAAASARMVDVFPPLTEEDIALINTTARERMDEQPEGTVLSWENPNTKHSGTVTLVERYTKQGMQCRRLRHSIRTARTAPWEIQVDICRDAQGDWAPAKP